MRIAEYWTGATLAFAGELAALAALAFYGYTLPTGTGMRVVAVAGLPLAAAVLWGLFAAPHAVVDVPALAVATRIVVQGGAVLALAVTGHPRLAGTLAAVVLLGQLLTSLAPAEARPAA